MRPTPTVCVSHLDTSWGGKHGLFHSASPISKGRGWREYCSIPLITHDMSRRTTASDSQHLPHLIPESQQDNDEDSQVTTDKVYHRVEAGSNSRSHQHLLCFMLHCGLVAIHVVLVVIYVRHLEHSVTFDINSFSTNFLPSIVSAVSQAVGTVRYLYHACCSRYADHFIARLTWPFSYCSLNA